VKEFEEPNHGEFQNLLMEAASHYGTVKQLAWSYNVMTKCGILSNGTLFFLDEFERHKNSPEEPPKDHQTAPKFAQYQGSEYHQDESDYLWN
jgi:hypothetical protein